MPIAVERPVIIVRRTAVMFLTALQSAADLFDEHGPVFFDDGVLTLSRAQLRPAVFQLLGRDEINLVTHLKAQHRIGLFDDVVRLNDRTDDLFDDVMQEFPVAVFPADDPAPVPLVDIQRMQVVHIVVPADGVHVGIDAGPGLIAIVPERVALPFGKALNDLALPFHVLHRKGDFSLHTVQVIVETAGLRHHERRGHAVEVQRFAEFELERIFDRFDRVLRFSLTEFTVISFRIDRIDHRCLPLIVDQILVDLPLRDLRSVVVPFRFLSGDVIVEYMSAEGLADERVFFGFGNGLFQSARQTVDAVGSQFLIAQHEHILVISGFRNKSSFDAVQTGCKAERHLQVRVAGRVRAAELDTGALAAAGRDPDQAGA